MGHETFPNPDITERTEIGAIEVLNIPHEWNANRESSPTSLDSAVGGASECNISHILGASFS